MRRNSTPVAALSDEERFLRRQILAWLWTLSFPAYCALVRLLLMRCGYATIRALPNDRCLTQGGFDLVAFCHTDISTFITAVSIKTGRVPVSRRLADEMRGALQRVGAEQGLLFATGSFSRRTRRVAGAPHLCPVHLIGGDEFAQLLIEHRLGVRQTGQGTWEFDPRFFEQLEQRAARWAT